MTRARKNRRGAALAIVAIFLALLFGFTAIGIDVGRLAHVATEVQTVADAAARGGAQALLDNGGGLGEGIDGAHLIANKNNMNGDPAQNTDVAVDEGFYDVATNEFECCTSNSPCCTNGSWGDQTCATASDCGSVSAVLAIPRVTVTNLFAGVFDFMDNGRLTTAEASGSPNKTTPIEKLAIARAGGPGSGCDAPRSEDGAALCSFGDWPCYCANGVAPCLPIAAPSCQFPAACTGAACQLPDLQVSTGSSTTNPDTAAWTVFQDIPASASTIRSFLHRPPTCPAPGNSDDPGEQDVSGAMIDVTNGVNGSGGNSSSTPFSLMHCIWENQMGCSIDGNGGIGPSPGTVFSIPIFDLPGGCTTQMNGTYQLLGFATVRITEVVIDGSEKRIEIETLANTTDTHQPPTGGCFGTDCSVALVK